MRVGYLQVYEEVDWVGYQIDQAMKLCDKLLITEGSQYSHTTYKGISERSADGTLDIISDKIKEYPKRVGCIGTIREYKDFRHNQCANFNRALSVCNINDYFIKLDADEFLFDNHIENLNTLMKESKVDVLGSYGTCFAFGFKWKFAPKGDELWGKKHIFKVTPELFFIPTCSAQNVGPVEFVDKESFDVCHYTWVRPRERVRLQIGTSGFYPDMLEWFDSNWDTLELKDGKQYDYYNDYFTLKRYDGKHPETLDEHPWLNVEDVRIYD